MPAPDGRFEQSYNAQAAVDTDTMLVVATALRQAANDKQQVAPMLETLGALPGNWARPRSCWPTPNVNRCADAQIEPLLAAGRDSHHLSWQERFGEPLPLAEPAEALEADAASAEDPSRKRKQTVEPVFGIIKAVMRFRQFLLRGLEAVRGEWSLLRWRGTSVAWRCWWLRGPGSICPS